MGAGTRYEQKTVKAVRGTDRLVISKWEKRGWELVDQTPGPVRTDLLFRRAKPRVPRQWLAFSAIGVVVAGAITVGALTEDDDPSPSHSSADEDTANIDDFLDAHDQGDLQEYAQGHNGDAMEFAAQVTGIGPDTLRSAPFLNLRAVVDGEKQGPLLQLRWAGSGQIPFPDRLETGDDVRVRANIDQYFSDDEVWLAPDDEDSFIQEQ